MATHSSTLAWKIPWTEEPGRLQSMRSLRVGHDWATSLSLFTFMHWRRKWQPTPMFLPGESQGRGAWWAAVSGVAQSWTRLKWCSSSSSSSSRGNHLYIFKFYWNIVYLLCFCCTAEWLSYTYLYTSYFLLWRLLCPCDSPGKNTGVVAIPFSRGSSQPRDRTWVSRIAAELFTIWATRESLPYPFFFTFISILVYYRMLNIIPCAIHGPHLVYPFIFKRHLGCFHVLAIVNKAAMTIRVHVPF